MINILLNGSEGRMGKAIADIVSGKDGIDIAAFCDAGKSVDEVSSEITEKIDVVLDISSPEGCMKALNWSVKNKKEHNN